LDAVISRSPRRRIGAGGNESRKKLGGVNDLCLVTGFVWWSEGEPILIKSALDLGTVDTKQAFHINRAQPVAINRTCCDDSSFHKVVSQAFRNVLDASMVVCLRTLGSQQ